MGRIFKRTMGDTNKITFCFHPINCHFKLFNVSVLPAKSRILWDEQPTVQRERSEAQPREKARQD